VTDGKYKCKDTDRDDIVVQRYLLNPLLLEGKKNGNPFLLGDRLCGSFGRPLPGRYRPPHHPILYPG